MHLGSVWLWSPRLRPLQCRPHGKRNRWKRISRGMRGLVPSLTRTPPPTFNALEPTVTPVCSMPSARPSWSTFRRKGVTRVTYVAPDHFLRKLGAHVSVEPPTLSRIKSNLGRKHPNKILVSVYLGLQSPPYPPSPVSCRGHFSQVHKRRCAYHPAEGRPGDNGEGDAHPLDSWLFSKVSQM